MSESDLAEIRELLSKVLLKKNGWVTHANFYLGLLVHTVGVIICLAFMFFQIGENTKDIAVNSEWRQKQAEIQFASKHQARTIEKMENDIAWIKSAIHQWVPRKLQQD